MIEDSLVIYRLSRAPERRIFYIDVGNLPKQKAEQYLRDVMMRYRNKLVYDANTGEIRDDKKYMAMLEDFWLPRREGGTLRDLYSFFLKYSISVISPRFCPPGRVEISVPLPPSRLGSQKSSSIAMYFLSSRISPVFASYTSLLR